MNGMLVPFYAQKGTSQVERSEQDVTSHVPSNVPSNVPSTTI